MFNLLLLCLLEGNDRDPSLHRPDILSQGPLSTTQLIVQQLPVDVASTRSNRSHPTTISITRRAYPATPTQISAPIIATHRSEITRNESQSQLSDASSVHTVRRCADIILPEPQSQYIVQPIQDSRIFERTEVHKFLVEHSLIKIINGHWTPDWTAINNFGPHTTRMEKLLSGLIKATEYVQIGAQTAIVTLSAIPWFFPSLINADLLIKIISALAVVHLSLNPIITRLEKNRDKRDEALNKLDAAYKKLGEFYAPPIPTTSPVGFLDLEAH